MRKFFLALAGVMALAAAPAQADSDFGVKAGLLGIENDNSGAVMAGIVYSMDLMGMVGVEFDAMMSVKDGEAVGPIAAAPFVAIDDYSATQVGAYAVFMTPGPLWFKAKAGLAYNKVDAGVIGDGTKTGAAYGIGVGFGIFEVELTRSKAAVDTVLGTFDGDATLLSVNVKF